MLIYDIEIQNLIAKKGEEVLADFKYCKGFDDFFGMGFACAATFDTARNEYRIFDEFMLEDLKGALHRTDVIVGFNCIRFDNKVLAPYEISIPENKCYDLLIEIAKAAGTPNDYKGLSLGAICKANFGTEKTGDGKNAPILYQRGRFGELHDYCLADVRLTKQLLDKILECGHIINPRTNKWIRVARPR
ncbi:MAG TPA: hypothetical protein PKY59_12195 [Pyrinomonadaceae bacterium]|nr:hypothetical protein [Pyrinomonadaceae bacterium]